MVTGSRQFGAKWQFYCDARTLAGKAGHFQFCSYFASPFVHSAHAEMKRSIRIVSESRSVVFDRQVKHIVGFYQGHPQMQRAGVFHRICECFPGDSQQLEFAIGQSGKGNRFERE